MDRHRICVVTTGGTIEALGRDADDLTGYMTTGQVIDPRDLIDRVDTDSLGLDVQHEPFANLPSPSICDSDWLALLAHLREVSAQCDGIVVTHGTNTLEETALFLAMTWPSDGPPLVLTGAMRPANARIADGESNLRAALRVAADPATRGRGVAIVFADRVLDPRTATKRHSDQLTAFDGREGGIEGYVDADGVVRYSRAARPLPYVAEVAEVQALPRVDVLLSHANADGVAIEALAAAGSRAIVIAGTGAGHPTERQIDALETARREGLVVARGSRSTDGTSLPHERFDGWVSVGRLLPWQARTVLAAGLTRTDDVASLQSLFDELQWPGITGTEVGT